MFNALPAIEFKNKASLIYRLWLSKIFILASRNILNRMDSKVMFSCQFKIRSFTFIKTALTSRKHSFYYMVQIAYDHNKI